MEDAYLAFTSRKIDIDSANYIIYQDKGMKWLLTSGWIDVDL